VDRVAAEAPDTLLLAEAFWLLDGYFVRTLGMHRVYNSAFMNMLKNEANSEYRQVIKNTLEFNPEILKRFVNFMNNPDEETAVAQFGKGDKYFGVCLLMATLPGLPMFGHGQVEGLTEKYGMEYRRAYWDETADQGLVERHEREIFPLLHGRALFAGVEHFLLYDFRTEAGVNQDVFAYSNRLGGSSGSRALVVYHNRYAETGGWIHLSCPVSIPEGNGRQLAQHSLGQGLGLSDQDNACCIFRDHLSGLEYLRRCRELHERGLYVQLQAYGAHVFLDFREVADSPERPYAALVEFLGGRGVPDMEAALKEVLLQPVQQPLLTLISAAAFRQLMACRREDLKKRRSEQQLPAADLSEGIDILSRSVKEFADAPGDAAALAGELKAKLLACLDLPSLETLLPRTAENRTVGREGRLLLGGGAKGERGEGDGFWALGDEIFTWVVLLGWLFVHALGAVSGAKHRALQSRSWIDEWLLGKLLLAAFEELGLSAEQQRSALALVKILTTHQRWFEGTPEERSMQDQEPEAAGVLHALMADTEVQEYLQINRYQGILWYHGESLHRLLTGLHLIALVDALSRAADDPARCAETILARRAVLQRIRRAEELSEYQVERLLTAVAD
jgi:hypothetical protein